MTEPLTILLLVVSGLAASILAAVTGFGGAAVLLPVLALVFGARDAIPILTVAQLIGNASRVAFNRKQLDLRVVKWFAIGGVPLGLFGGWLFAKAPLGFLHQLLGAFLILMVLFRIFKRKILGEAKERRPFDVRWFGAVGAVSTLLSALVGSVGPLMAPLFLAYGLMKGAYIGTEALATVVMHVSKLVAYGWTDLLNVKIVAIGVMLGGVLFVGSYVGKRIVDRVSEKMFVLIIEVTLVAAGIYFLAKPYL